MYACVCVCVCVCVCCIHWMCALLSVVCGWKSKGQSAEPEALAALNHQLAG